MLRNYILKSTLDSLSLSGFNISQNLIGVQSVRWHRKPRWVPMARSKLFKIPELPYIPPEEKDEWQRINNNYRTQMRSIRAFFRDEVERKKNIVAQELTPADEEAEFQRCSAINEDWNFEISRKRDKRIEKENAERAEYILTRVEAKKIRDNERLAKIEEIVKKEKEASPSFITSANIDQAIEAALANPIDYSFSIDLQGTIYKGSERPGKATKKEETS